MIEAVDPARIASLVEQRRVRDIAMQLRNSLPPVIAADSLLAYLIYQSGLTMAAAVWWSLVMTWVSYRSYQALRLAQRRPEQVGATLKTLRRGACVSGLLRAVPVVLVAVAGDSAGHLLVSMITIGLAAGTVATSGGDRTAMLYWGIPVFGALSLSWLWRATPTGVLLGLLLMYLFRILYGYVDLLGRQSAALIESAEQLRIERDRAAAASDAKTRFLAAASHDLRQPMYALGLYAATLDELAIRIADSRLEPVRQGIRRALNHTRGLLDSLLDISKLEAMAIQVQPQDIDLRAFLQDIATTYAGQAREKGLVFELDVPSGVAHESLRSDPVLLTRLVGNLVENALKFTERGGVTLALMPGAEPQRVRIEVRDTGPGIAAAEHTRVFEEFYQVGNPGRDRSQGLGLGLSIVARLAALLDAKVRLRSEPGRGASFSIEVGPVQAAGPVVAKAAVCEPDCLSPLGKSAGRVLIIDDEADIRAGLVALLGLRGWSVIAAAGSTEAVALLESDALPDVLLVDYRLATETGIEAIARVHQRTGPVPAVLVTGDTAPERIVESAAAGYPVLHKSVDPRTVIAALELAMRDVGRRKGR